MKDLYFVTPEQEQFYRDHESTADARGDDSAALVYILGISETCRDHFRDIYDSADNSIKPEALRAPWQTGSSVKLTRLAFNLFTWQTAPGDDPDKYTPKALFSGLDADQSRAAAQALLYFA